MKRMYCERCNTWVYVSDVGGHIYNCPNCGGVIIEGKNPDKNKMERG